MMISVEGKSKVFGANKTAGKKQKPFSAWMLNVMKAIYFQLYSKCA